MTNTNELTWRHTRHMLNGMKLGTLLRVVARNGFHVHRNGMGRLAALTGVGVVNSIVGACESLMFDREIRAAHIEHPPLFILGHWRSGTTHLQNLLNCDELFNSPNAFQTSFPHLFAMMPFATPVFNLFAPRTRPMDNVVFSAQAPHEDEFAIAAMATVSPYMRILFPVTGDLRYSQLDPLMVPEHALTEWKHAFTYFLKKMTLLDPRRLVLKSPPHTTRIRMLLELFPDSKFVHIVRDPYTVYASTKKLWDDTLVHSQLQDIEPEDVERLILSWYSEMFALYERDRGLIPEGSLVEVKHEDVEERPIETLRSIYDGLALPGFAPFQERVSGYLKTLKGYRKNSYFLNEATKDIIVRQWREVFERYDYPL